MSVHQLPFGVIKLISSSQVISSVASVIKELVENSIDANASVIDIKLEKYGLDKIEVRDDGPGILAQDVHHICLPNYTSKIHSFEDLESLNSYGFRGEALNSMCAISNLSITTKTKHDEHASTFVFDSSGTVREVQPSHLMKGTIVTVSNLFRNVPVRRQFYENTRKATEELKKIEKVVKTLSVIHPKLRITIAHNKCLIWHKTCVNSLRQSLMQVYPHVVLKNLEYFLHSVDDLKIELLICKRDCNWSVLCQPLYEAILFYVNRRPVKDKKVEKVLLEEMTYLFQSALPSNKCPLTLISIHLPPQDLDVNLEPDKTRVFIKNHVDVLKHIRDAVLMHFYKQPIRESNSDNCDGSNPEITGRMLDDSVNSDGANPELKRRKLDDSDNVCMNDGISSNNSSGVSGSFHGSKLSVEESNPIASLSSFEDNSAVHDLDEIEFPDEVRNIVLKESGAHDDSERNSSCFREETGIARDVDQLANATAIDVMNESHISLPESALSSSNDAYVGVSDETNIDRPVTSEYSDMISLLSQNDGNYSRTLSQTTLSQWSKGQVYLDEERLKGPNLLVPAKYDGSNLNGKNEISKNSKLSIPSKNKVLERSVSSQMGRKDMAGLTNFVRTVRSEIIQKNPGMSFTKVASELANCWRNLNESKKNEFAEKAKEAKSLKSKSSASKAQPLKMKRIIHLNADIDCIKARLNSWSRFSNDADIRLISSLRTNSECLCRIQNSIVLIDVTGLQENVLYHRYLCNSSIPLKQLDEPIQITAEQIGCDHWSFLLTLDRSVYNHEIVITDPRISKNGFNIVIKETCDDIQVFVTKIAKESGFNVIENLIEVLKLSVGHSDLKFCRPEAIKSLLLDKVKETIDDRRVLDNIEIEMLLQYWSQRMTEVVCLPSAIPVSFKICKLSVEVEHH